MLILIDLDGTILNTVHPSWNPYKEGRENYRIDNILDKIPFVDGAKDFVKTQQNMGNTILIVSDSHPKYVEPISRYLGLDCVSLANKPNDHILLSFFAAHPDYQEMIDSKECIFIGDTVLDIELGRRLRIPTIWILPYRVDDDIKDDVTKVGDEMASLKMGPTYSVKSFAAIRQILDDPINNLYSIESSFAGGKSFKAIKYAQNRFADGSYAAIRCLARQEAGSCDKYARGDKYYMMSNQNRPFELVSNLADSISTYINQPSVINEKWDFVTYMTDKQTTVPQDKMKEIFDLVKTNIPKVKILKWASNVNGSLRNRNLYSDRREFLEQYLTVNAVGREESTLFQSINESVNITDKNIIVIDDQLTTSATAWFVIHKLKEKGARNIMFIALFQMALPVESNMICPHCGKIMQIKIRHSDGCKFYSCIPPKYGGDGCGFCLNILDQ